MIVIIPAGGAATRLWPLSKTTAKPLLLLGDKPIISHLVDRLSPRIPIIVAANKQFEADFNKWRARCHPHRKNLEIFIEPTKKNGGRLGALGSLAYLVKHHKINEDVLVLLGDNIVTFDLDQFIKKAKDKITLAAFDIKSKADAKRFGVVSVDKAGTITEFREKPSEPKSTLVSTGVYYFPKRELGLLTQAAAKNPDNMGSFVEFLVDGGRKVKSFRFSTPWYDIGSFAVYLEVHRKLGKRRGGLKKFQSGGNRFRGSVFIDPTCQVKDSFIEDSIIFENCLVENSRLRRCIIDKGCIIRGVDLEYKMLETKTVID